MKRLAPFDRKSDPAAALDPRVAMGRLKAIAKPRLKNIIEQSSKSQADLARTIGVSRASVTRWIKGDAHMPNRRIIEVSYMHDVSPFWLLGIVEDRAIDWRLPSLPAGQYETAAEKRRELSSLLEAAMDRKTYLKEYQADYREPIQLLFDMVCFRNGRDLENSTYTPALDILINGLLEFPEIVKN